MTTRRDFLSVAAIAAVGAALPRDARAQMPLRRIFASSGGITASNNLLLMEYLLAMPGKKDPLITLLPTPQADSAQAVMNWYELMNDLPCRPRHLRVFGNSSQMKSFEPRLLSSDIIFVGPGSTLNAMALWSAQGVDVMLRKAWEKGVILAGESAGLVCWFEQGITDSRPERLSAMNGLGFLEGSVCPHYDSEAQRRTTYHALIQSGEVKGGLGCDNWTALLYEGTQLKRVVASRPEKRVYQVRLVDGKVKEDPLPVELLRSTP